MKREFHRKMHPVERSSFDRLLSFAEFCPVVFVRLVQTSMDDQRFRDRSSSRSRSIRSRLLCQREKEQIHRRPKSKVFLFRFPVRCLFLSTHEFSRLGNHQRSDFDTSTGQTTDQ